MMKSVVILTVVMAYLSTLGAASRCDDNIINTIREKFWNNGRCVTRDVLRTATFLSPEIVKLTTNNYYAEDEKISCLYSIFDGAHVDQYALFDNSSAVNGPIFQVDLIEENGVTIVEGTKVFRYMLYANRLGVTALYRCSETGEVGAPEGLIKVSARGYEQESYIQSIKDLECLGINVTEKVFDDSCLQ